LNPPSAVEEIIGRRQTAVQQFETMPKPTRQRNSDDCLRFRLRSPPRTPCQNNCRQRAASHVQSPDLQLAFHLQKFKSDLTCDQRMAHIRQIVNFDLNFASLKLRNVVRLYKDIQSIHLTPIQAARFAAPRAVFKSRSIKRKALAPAANLNPPKIDRNARFTRPRSSTQLGEGIFTATGELRWIWICVMGDKENG
jgi:hypothetical protein